MEVRSRRRIKKSPGHWHQGLREYAGPRPGTRGLTTPGQKATGAKGRTGDIAERPFTHGRIPWRLAKPGGHRNKREQERVRNAPLNQREHSTRCAKFLITFSSTFVGTCSSENDETFRDPCRMLRASERLAAYLVTLKSNHRAPQSRNTGGGAFQQTC